MFDEKIAPLADAIRSRTSMSATYKSEAREFSPHALGKGRYGEDVVLVYQYAGMSGGRTTAGLPPERCWRMFVLEDLRDLAPNEGGWHSHESYQSALERLTGVSTAVEADAPQYRAEPDDNETRPNLASR